MENVDPMGDCPSPKSIMIRIFEDRLGNHVGVIYNEEGAIVRTFKTQTRVLPAPLQRRPFSDPVTIANLELALIAVEGKENAPK